MQIKDYITKNFPSLNWNILPQIFEENGVEMNEEIEAYLRNTPENTNWSILEQLGGSGGSSEGKLLFDEIINCWDDDDGESSYYIGRANFIPIEVPSKITILFDDETYENIDMTIYDQSYSIQGAAHIDDNILSYITIQVAKASGYVSSVAVAAQQSGNHHVVIYDVG